MKKSIMILIMVTTGFFCSGQSSKSTPDSVYVGTLDSVKAKDSIKSETKDSTTLPKYKDSLAQASLLKAELSKAIEDGTIYKSTSPHHNVLHQFTYSTAMRDFCNKTVLQMRANGEINKKLSKELERELLNAKAELTSSKYNGLKIESGLYEVFLKQINDRFRD